MNSIALCVLLYILNYKYVNASVTINRYDNNECILDHKLVEEISSYKNVTQSIMKAIITDGLGQAMYQEYSNFIDKFGARPSGTQTLENSIDHMINLTLKHGLDDVTTEELEVCIIQSINPLEASVLLNERYVNKNLENNEGIIIKLMTCRDLVYICIILLKILVSGLLVFGAIIEYVEFCCGNYELFKVPHWVRGRESIRMISPRSHKIAVIGLGSSVSTPPEGITAEVIVISSFQELDKANETDVKGKIVLYDAHYVSYGDTVIYRSQGASKAAKKGAVASLIRSITPFSIYSPHTGAQFYDSDVTKIPAAAITLEDADLLRRFQNQGEKIIINLKMSNSYDTKKSRNTIIDLKGKENPEKMVIVSGHIDSWDVGQGAMDDGGGMMISWFAPVVLNRLNLKPRRTLRAILWTSEEPGLIGAAAYLDKHKEDLSNINFIMESDEGTFNPLGLDVAGSTGARCIIAEILKLFSPVDKMTNSGSPGSDIVMFIRKGIPGASLLNENERYFWFHHSEGDTMNVQNMVDVVNCAAFWTAVSYVISDISVDIPRQ